MMNLLIFLLFLTFYGCRTFEPATVVKNIKIYSGDNKRVNILAQDGTRRSVYLLSDDIVKFCAEPSPDMGLNTNTTVNIVTPKGDLIAENKEKIIALEGRTQRILFLREAMYRLCEMNLNYGKKVCLLPKNSNSENQNITASQDTILEDEKISEEECKKQKGKFVFRAGFKQTNYLNAYYKILLTALILDNPEFAKSNVLKDIVDTYMKDGIFFNPSEGKHHEDPPRSGKEELQQLQREIERLRDKLEIYERFFEKSQLNPKVLDNSRSGGGCCNNYLNFSNPKDNKQVIPPSLHGSTIEKTIIYFSSVFFPYNKASLTSEGEFQIQEIKKFLEIYPEMTFSIVGHASPEAQNQNVNKELAICRALEVKKKLLQDSNQNLIARLSGVYFCFKNCSDYHLAWKDEKKTKPDESFRRATLHFFPKDIKEDLKFQSVAGYKQIESGEYEETCKRYQFSKLK